MSKNNKNKKKNNYPSNKVNTVVTKDIDNNDNIEKTSKDNNTTTNNVEVNNNVENNNTPEENNFGDKPQLTDFLGNANEIFSTNKQKYESTMSSAIILLIFGCGGMFVEILGVLGIIYLPLMTFQYILMFVVFSFFIVFGVLSYHKANSFVAGMNKEDEQRNKVNYFLNDLLTDQVLKDLKSDELSEEENYYLIIDKLRDMILEKYPEYDTELLEYMIDDYLNEHFKA